MSKFQWEIINESIKKVNEDITYADENMAWVLDGATGLTDKKLTSFESDARWFVNEWDKYLKDNLNDKCKTIRDIVLEGIVIIRDRFYKECGLNYIEEIKRPSASISIVRKNEDIIEYFMLGDCTLLIKDIDNNVAKIKDTSLEKFDNRAISEMLKVRDENNISWVEARKIINPILIENRLLKNTQDGYWILEFNEEAVNHCIEGKFLDKEIKNLALMSDGFAAIVDTYKHFNEAELIERLIDLGAENTYELIREIEEEDKDILKYPRLKKGDDSSIVFLNNYEC